MLLFLTPLFAALGASIFGIYYVQRTLSARSDNIQIKALADKLYKAAGIHVYYIYGAIILSGLFLSLLLITLFSFSLSLIAGFFLGIFSAIGVGHFALFFLMKLNARLADRSARGLIDAFHAVFEGGNALGVFVLGAVMLVASVFYVSFTTASIIEGFISIALGGVLASLFIKIGADFYAKTIVENKDIFEDIDDVKNETRDPETIANLAAHNLRHGIGVLVDVFETALLSALGTILVALFVLPGFLGAAALPLMVMGVGFISTTVSGKLIKTGSTVNITKNIFFTTLSVVITASLLVFPVILWTVSEGFQYGPTILWATVFSGFLSAGLISVLYYLYSAKKLKQGVGASLVIFFLMLGVFASFVFAGLYGIALYVSSIIALAPLYIALSIFSSVSNSVYKMVDITDLPEERKRIIQKLSFVSPVMRGSSAVYFFTASLFSAVVYFYLYQRNMVSKFPEIELSLANPIIFIGMFFGGIGLYAIISSMLFAHKRMDSILKNSEVPAREEGMKSGHYAVLMRKITAHIVRASAPPVLFVFIVPLAAVLVLGIEGFAGFLVGGILAGGFWGFVLLFERENANTKEDPAQDNVFNKNSDTIILMISSALKATAVFSLLLIILF